MTVRADERRSDQRLRYSWSMEYARSAGERFTPGRMVDVSATGAAFICSAQEVCPGPGKVVITRFSVPCFDSDISFDKTSFNRISRVCRVDDISDSVRRVAVQFVSPLPLKPGEQRISEYDRTYRLSTGNDGSTADCSFRGFSSSIRPGSLARAPRRFSRGPGIAKLSSTPFLPSPRPR